jgi:hypothetical protein
MFPVGLKYLLDEKAGIKPENVKNKRKITTEEK